MVYLSETNESHGTQGSLLFLTVNPYKNYFVERKYLSTRYVHYKVVPEKVRVRIKQIDPRSLEPVIFDKVHP